MKKRHTVRNLAAKTRNEVISQVLTFANIIKQKGSAAASGEAAKIEGLLEKRKRELTIEDGIKWVVELSEGYGQDDYREGIGFYKGHLFHFANGEFRRVSILQSAKIWAKMEKLFGQFNMDGQHDANIRAKWLALVARCIS